MTELLFDRIKRHEGFCFKPKYDAKGMWVIGYGHDLTEEEAAQYANGISESEAKTLLDNDLDFCEEHLFKELPWALWIDEIRQNILIEIAFQLGVMGLLKFKEMLAAIQIKDWDKAAHEMLDSQWHKQTPDRCEELAALMLNGTTTTN